LECIKKILILITIILTLGTISFFFNPEDSIWFPKCPFYVITGYQCPSCGIQRAAYQLLHLNFKAAFCYNPFLIISLPYAISLIIVTWLDPKEKLIRLKNFCYNKITVYVYLTLMVIWWIVRNFNI